MSIGNTDWDYYLFYCHHFHQQIEGILAVGWDDSVPKPVCVELDPEAQTRVAAFNVNLVKQSKLSLHPLASVDPKTVKYSSLAASHTSAVLSLCSP